MTLSHIKIPEIAPITRYLCNGIQTVFSFPFPIFASSDLVVRVNGAEQVSGYVVAGAGETGGGTVTFATPPVIDTILTLERDLPIERMTDFLEGGNFSAKALNTELDIMVASLQQIERQNDRALIFSDQENPSYRTLPDVAIRRNKGLGFNGDGEPVALDLNYATAGGNFTVTGTGAQTRTVPDKLSDLVSIKDFGAIGDGLTDDTLAIQLALAAHDAVFIPSGTYLTSATILVGARKTLIGSGQMSVIRANGSHFNVLELTGDYITLSCFRIEQGQVGLKLWGRDRPCVQNAVSDLTIWQAQIGIQLDGTGNGDYPCYWNNFDRVLVAQPFVHGVHLVRSGGAIRPMPINSMPAASIHWAPRPAAAGFISKTAVLTTRWWTARRMLTAPRRRLVSGWGRDRTRRC